METSKLNWKSSRRGSLKSDFIAFKPAWLPDPSTIKLEDIPEHPDYPWDLFKQLGKSGYLVLCATMQYPDRTHVMTDNQFFSMLVSELLETFNKKFAVHKLIGGINMFQKPSKKEPGKDLCGWAIYWPLKEEERKEAQHP
jgi:hypothetical protein